MKLPSEGARWLISLRWLASASVFVVIWLSSSLLGVIVRPLPLYIVACAMLGYNLVLWLNQRGSAKGEGNVDRQIFLQVAFDLTALTLLLYFSDLPRNPFLFYYVFHMIIAGMYLARFGAVFLCRYGHRVGGRADALGAPGLDILVPDAIYIARWPAARVAAA